MYRSMIFLTSTLAEGEWSVSQPGRFTPGERTPRTHWIGGWVDPRAGLNTVERKNFLTKPGLKRRSLGRPARRQSLYRLSCLGSINWICVLAFKEPQPKSSASY
jgi:hypothetical protein